MVLKQNNGQKRALNIEKAYLILEGGASVLHAPPQVPL